MQATRIFNSADQARDRSFGVAEQTGVIAILLLAGIMSFRPVGDTGLDQAEFDQDRLNWSDEADIVVAGDSRVQIGVDPAVMEQSLTGQRVLNFGFPSVGWTPCYLNAVVQVLHKEGSNRTVILGLTPYSFTPAAARKNGFVAARSSPRSKSLIPLFATRGLSRMRIGTAIKSLVMMRSPVSHLNSIKPNGHWAFDLVTRDPNHELDTYRRHYAGENCFDTEQLEHVVNFILNCRKQRIRVLCFRPPTTEKMRVLEDEFSGYIESDIQAAVKSAGGEWCSLPPTDWITSDGSHLVDSSVGRLSLLLACFVSTSNNDQN